MLIKYIKLYIFINVLNHDLLKHIYGTIFQRNEFRLTFPNKKKRFSKNVPLMVLLSNHTYVCIVELFID